MGNYQSMCYNNLSFLNTNDLGIYKVPFMPFTLDYLNQLTHSQIETAIEYVRKKFNYPLNTLVFFEYSPYLRLFDLISPVDKCEKQVAFELMVLAKLSGGNDYELGWLSKHSRLVVATRIFLKFKIHGNEYLSDYGNNNTCLHDAVLTCAWRTKELTRLLIQNGANPSTKNDENLTAAALYMKQILPTESIEFPWAYSSHKASLSKMLLTFVAWVMEYHPKSTLAALNGLDLYIPLKQHPDLLIYRPMADDRTLLHKAVAINNVEVVEWLLEHGANPESLMIEKIKPIHIALVNLKDSKNTNDCLKIIALLITYELIRSISQYALSAWQIGYAVLKLNISNKVHRCEIALLIHAMDCLNPLPFSVNTLISIVNNQPNILARNHIKIDFSSKIGVGTYGNIYKGLAFINKNGPEEVAIKLNKRVEDILKTREEATLLSQLNHPNIVRFICTIERNTNSFGYIMNYAAGGDLGTFLEENSKPLSAECLYSFCKQMNEGLRYLHDQGYVHLDLKPANILLDNAQNPEASRVQLADFGATARIGQTRTSLLTTITFCSPEGFDLKCPYAIGHDTYSFGLCLGYMDTKNHPWLELGYDLDKYTFDIIERVRKGERTIFQEKPMSLKVAPLVKWCWEKEPSKRPSHDHIDSYLDRFINPNANTNAI